MEKYFIAGYLSASFIDFLFWLEFYYIPKLKDRKEKK